MFELNLTFQIAFAAAILIIGNIYFVPYTLIFYGRHYFNWRQNQKAPAHINGLAIVMGAAFSWYCASQCGARILPYAALLFVSLWGVCLVDYHFKVIPDRFHITGTLATIGCVLSIRSNNASYNLWENIASGLLVVLCIYLFSALYSRLRNRTGLGFGDIKLLSWTSWFFGQEILQVVLLASVLVFAIAIIRIVNQRRLPKSGEAFAFGPFLSVATLLNLLVVLIHSTANH